jgi:cell fate (sporulation/competence/biofilm development) regulator YlbF (YheA/YmcA/DUF963 family)
MQQAIELAETLNSRIRNSEEYRTYQETLNRLKQQRELYERFNEFRRRNYELQSAEGDSNLYDEVFSLVKEYDAVLQESVVHDFRVAEHRLNALMREVCVALSDGLELDYSYLEG